MKSPEQKTPAKKPRSRQSKAKPAEASEAPASQPVQTKPDAPEAPRQPVKKILATDLLKEPTKWLSQLQEALEDIASDLGFIESFDLAREQETLASPTSHVETRIGALWVLWEGTVNKAVGLFGEIRGVTDNIPQPLIGAKDCIEAATDILRDLGAKGQAMIDNWDDLAHPPTKLTEKELKAFPDNVLVVAEGFAEYVKRSQFPVKLQDVVCRLRGYAVRGQTRKKPWSKSRKGFISLTLAHRRYCTSGTAPKLPMLSKLCRLDGSFDYMREPGLGCCVDEQQFEAWANTKNYTKESVQKAEALLVAHKKSPAGRMARLHKQYDVNWQEELSTRRE